MVFEDYGSDLGIQPSCADDRLTQRLFDLPSGTKMKLLVKGKTNEIMNMKFRVNFGLILIREQARRQQCRNAMENLNWTPKKISR